MYNHVIILSQFNYKSMEAVMCNINTDTTKYSSVECEMFDKPSYSYISLTLTGDSSVFRVDAVMIANSIVEAAH